MTVTPAVEEEEEEPQAKKRFSFKFPLEETEMGIIAGIIGAVIVIFTGLPAVIKGVGLILVLLWGMDSVRKTSKYGLGTGVPSIGVLGTGYGVVGAIMGLAVAEYGRVGQIYPAVLLGVIVMGVIGLVSGVISNSEKFIAMKIPRLERGMMELGMTGTLAILLECSIVTGSLNFNAVVDNVMSTGLIALMFIFTCFAMLHPYNACLGADERRERTRMCGVEISGLVCILLGFAQVALGTSPYGVLDGVSMIVFGAIIFAVFFRKFVKACMDEAYETVGTGLIKTIE